MVAVEAEVAACRRAQAVMVIQRDVSGDMDVGSRDDGANDVDKGDGERDSPQHHNPDGEASAEAPWWEEPLGYQIVCLLITVGAATIVITATGWDDNMRSVRDEDPWWYLLYGAGLLPLALLLFSLAPRYIPTAEMG